MGTIITVPMHPGREIGLGLLRKIMRDIEISRDELIELMRKL